MGLIKDPTSIKKIRALISRVTFPEDIQPCVQRFLGSPKLDFRALELEIDELHNSKCEETYSSLCYKFITSIRMEC